MKSVSANVIGSYPIFIFHYWIFPFTPVNRHQINGALRESIYAIEQSLYYRHEFSVGNKAFLCVRDEDPFVGCNRGVWDAYGGCWSQRLRCWNISVYLLRVSMISHPAKKENWGEEPSSSHDLRALQGLFAYMQLVITLWVKDLIL